jgi:hypothetical protein
LPFPNDYFDAVFDMKVQPEVEYDRKDDISWPEFCTEERRRSKSC